MLLLPRRAETTLCKGERTRVMGTLDIQSSNKYRQRAVKSNAAHSRVYLPLVRLPSVFSVPTSEVVLSERYIAESGTRVPSK